MAGCECIYWKRATEKGTIFKGEGLTPTLHSRPRWFIKNGETSIHYCPWCGSKLTEEAGDAE